MGINTIDAGMLKNVFLVGAKGLEARKDWINELNAFPVPDGDTGTNVTLTIMVVAREVAELDNPIMNQLARAISSGPLRGVRGNSGVILSQFLRGLTKEIKSATEIDTTILANAVVRGTETAYKAVMKPKEGTILTVAKGMSDKVLEMASQTGDIEEFARVIIEHGNYVLSQTPGMLPVLGQAGTVDSNDQGLIQMVKNAVDGLLGKTVDLSLSTEPEQREEPPRAVASRSDIDTADIKFGYCTEFTIDLEKEYSDQDEIELRAYLESIGDSLVVVSDDEIVKVHMHTNHPGLAFEKTLAFGSPPRMKVDNTKEEHQEWVIEDSERMVRGQVTQNLADIQTEPEEHKEHGFIAVSSGDGFSEVSKGIGAGYLIEGGQTTNPSIEDMLNTIDKVNAENILIPPNNKNITIAAQQARDLTEDKNIIVISSRTMLQGITALVSFMPDLLAEENLNDMTGETLNVKTAQITYAVRTTKIDGMDIEEGDIMVIGDQGMLAVGKSVESIAMDALDATLDQDSELVTVYYGCDVPQNAVESLIYWAAQLCPDEETELQYGGQPTCYYMIFAEQAGVCRQKRLGKDIRYGAMGSG